MRTFRQRRTRNLLLLAAGVLLLGWLVQLADSALWHTAYGTGYTLLAALFFLAAYPLRKRFPFLPLGRTATWLQCHVYVGCFTAVLFGWHLRWQWPNGVLETTVAVLYLIVFSSGLCGLYVTRVFPRRLGQLGEEFLLERIPAYQHQLRHEARQLALRSVSVTGNTTLADFYLQRLGQFFDAPRSWQYQLLPSSRQRRQLMAELAGLQRYCSDDERSLSDRLFQLVRKKDDLDYHQALQRWLRGWLFVHAGLTYSLLLVACLHGWLAYTFRGGAG